MTRYKVKADVLISAQHHDMYVRHGDIIELDMSYLEPIEEPQEITDEQFKDQVVQEFKNMSKILRQRNQPQEIEKLDPDNFGDPNNMAHSYPIQMNMFCAKQNELIDLLNSMRKGER